MTRTPDTRRAILVLGAAVLPGGAPSAALSRRTRHAAALWRAGRAEAIVACGGVGRHPPAEAEVMRRILIAEGVPPGVILCEVASTSTAGNIRLALPILDGLGIASVLIVSDAWHLPRARLLARRSGLEVETGAPPWRSARRLAQLKGALREIPAVLAALLHLER
ncbi:YdcF family protein [Roseibacterium sp. SDUM158017]|uniref:YdcF family protein n=1 Tax=Roseicyclus salinarum TaxID=3036773 RepID=UPI0024156581|nr:YdcF family protein [Roseibacterium sp. SDUM158017]MDG4650314.1 YdcF family protein [Roseibacterium sp. SDUM158017]